MTLTVTPTDEQPTLDWAVKFCSYWAAAGWIGKYEVTGDVLTIDSFIAPERVAHIEDHLTIWKYRVVEG